MTIIKQRTLFLVGGIAGSGKTFAARRLANLIQPEAVAVFAADDYFYVEGEYHFDPAGLPLAHQKCQQDTMDAMDKGVTAVFVHNTFIQEWEWERYLTMATMYDYDVVRLLATNIHGHKSEHDFPVDKITEKFEQLVATERNLTYIPYGIDV